MTVTFCSGTPHLTSRSLTAPDTAMVMSENSPVPKYSARTPGVIRCSPSRCVSPIECSVLTTTGTPAIRAAGLAYTCERY